MQNDPNQRPGPQPGQPEQPSQPGQPGQATPPLRQNAPGQQGGAGNPPPYYYYGQPYGRTGARQTPPPPHQPPQNQPENTVKLKAHPMHIGFIAIALALLLFAATFLFVAVSVSSTLGSLFRGSGYNNNPSRNSFSVIQVVGAIANYGSDALGINDPSYHHNATLNHIKQLKENESNGGILLYMNTPGGGVYESDELYLALMDYKETTGRPVWAYMADQCASGGYYVCAAADYIVANRNTVTGSIGVYIALTDVSGLYEKLGIETVLVRSGEHKGTGMSGVPITDEQRAVYQSIVDEDYNVFVDIITEGRGMGRDEVLKLADGRIYTARQAVQNGLVDELGDIETILAEFEEETGCSPFYTSFSNSTPIGSILSGIFANIPENETQTMLSAAEKYPTGVPMVLYDPAA